MTPRKTTRVAAKKRASKRASERAPKRATQTKPNRTPQRKPPRAAPSTSTGAPDVEAQLQAIERGDGEGELDLGRGVTLHVSSLGKPYFPEAGVTKGALMRYYTRVAPLLLPELDGRPLILKRYPDGVAGPMFFQQDAGLHVPDVVRVESLQTEEKGIRARIIGGSLATLLYTVQLGAVEVHPWLSRINDIASPDRCLIDLDPGDGVPFSAVVELARDVLRIVEQCELSAAVKTSGSRGIHVVLPLPARTSYDTSAQLAMLVARAVAALRPDRATVERSIHSRPTGTIYVDAMQNARGKSMASVYSVRARSNAPVSAPLDPRELTGRLRLSTFTVDSMRARLARTGDTWSKALDRVPTGRALSRAIQVLETTLAADTPEHRSESSGTKGGASAASKRGRRARRA
jgi:bifunctional non-homologous end joining protein LigD